MWLITKGCGDEVFRKQDFFCKLTTEFSHYHLVRANRYFPLAVLYRPQSLLYLFREELFPRIACEAFQVDLLKG
jgi:hypothetical protein